jgi:hypothetical protein
LTSFIFEYCGVDSCRPRLQRPAPTNLVMRVSSGEGNAVAGG